MMSLEIFATAGVPGQLLLPGAGPESPTTLRESVFFRSAIVPTEEQTERKVRS